MLSRRIAATSALLGGLCFGLLALADQTYEIDIPALGINKLQVVIRQVGTPVPTPAPTPTALALSVPTDGDLAACCQRIAPQGTITIAASCALTAPAVLKVDGVTIQSDASRVVVDCSQIPVALTGDCLTVQNCSGVTLRGLVLDGGFAPRRGIKIRDTASQVAITNCETRKFSKHAVDVDGTDILIDGCESHHNLAVDAAGNRTDAHGIVVMLAKGVSIRSTKSHHNSGDSFQADRGTWDNLTLEDDEFYDAPLEADMGGFKAGQRVSENAIDTKHKPQTNSGPLPQGRITIKHLKAYGFRSSFITNCAAMHLKENVSVALENCQVDDCQIGLWCSTFSIYGNMSVMATNCSVRNCDVAGRIDNQNAFTSVACSTRLAHCTFVGNGKLFDFPNISGSPLDPNPTKRGNGWKLDSGAFNCLADKPTPYVWPGMSPPEFGVGFLKSDGNNITPGATGIPIPDWALPAAAFDAAGAPRDPQQPKVGA